MKTKLILIAFVLVLLPSLAFASFDTSLKFGSKGSAVLDLQDFLQDQGTFTGKVDGKFGFGTLRAVKAWQVANNLKADGYFGLSSRTLANSVVDSLTADSNVTEQSETGTISNPSTVQGCTSTSLFSTKTGQPCNETIQPTATYPAGCTSLSGFSMTTGQKCDTTVQTQLSTISTTLNTIAQNTTPSVVPTPTPIIPVLPVVPPTPPAPACTISTELVTFVPGGASEAKVHWTSTNATSGVLQRTDGGFGFNPTWDLSKEVNAGDGNTVASGTSLMYMLPQTFRIVVNGDGGQATCTSDPLSN